MRKDLEQWLCCPVDGAYPLQIVAFETNEEEVVTGALVCPQCLRWYAIMGGIPHLVRDGLRLVEEELALLQRFADRLPSEAATWKPFGSGSAL